jgi:hypothetical protein
MRGEIAPMMDRVRTLVGATWRRYRTLVSGRPPKERLRWHVGTTLGCGFVALIALGIVMGVVTSVGLAVGLIEPTPTPTATATVLPTPTMVPTATTSAEVLATESAGATQAARQRENERDVDKLKKWADGEAASHNRFSGDHGTVRARRQATGDVALDLSWHVGSLVIPLTAQDAADDLARVLDSPGLCVEVKDNDGHSAHACSEK